MKAPVINVVSDQNDKHADSPAEDPSSPVASDATVDAESATHHEITVTPAFPNFSTNEERPNQPESTSIAEEPNDAVKEETSGISVRRSPSRHSQRSFRLVDELRYLLKPTNSLASPAIVTQTSQEGEGGTYRRSLYLNEDTPSNGQRLLIEGLTPQEAKSLNAAQRRSMSAHGHRPSSIGLSSDTPRARTLSRPSITVSVPDREHRTLISRLFSLFWAFMAAYAFTLIIFLMRTFGIDLTFGFCVQMLVQTIAFAVYAFYKGYSLLGPSEHRLITIGRGVLIGLGTLTSFLAYYYIALPDLSAVRQTQVIFTIVLSIAFLRERMTVTRIIAGLLSIIALVFLLRPSLLGASFDIAANSTASGTAWIPHSSSGNRFLGIGLALCTALMFSVASILRRRSSSNEPLHNSVLCFWAALSALIVSTLLLCVTQFVVKDARFFPNDWRLFVTMGLALASMFVFIANQKAIKRQRSSIVTLIYATDIILALILQNVFTHVHSGIIIIIGCVLILIAIVIVCIEVFLIEQKQNALSVKFANVVKACQEPTPLPNSASAIVSLD